MREGKAGAGREIEAVFALSLFGVAETDLRSRRFKRVNRRFCEMTGYTAAELENLTASDITHPEDRERDQLVSQALLRGDVGERQIEKRYLCKDGSVVWVQVASSLVRNEHDEPTSALGIIQDITERKRAEAALQASEQRFRSLFEQTLSGTAEVDLTGRFIQVNERYCRIIGRSREEVLALRMHDITHPDDLPVNLELIAALKAGEIPGFELEKRYLRPDGSAVWVHNSVSLVHDAQGRTQSIVVSTLDITERKRTEEALREADRRKDEFLAILAHELRNPLAPIRNAVHILRAPNAGEKQREWGRDVIHRQVQQMARLIDDLLDVSRITRGKLALRKELVPIQSIVAAAIETARPLIDAKGHQLSVDLPEQPVRVKADPVRMTQVLGNLLNNAAKYTDPGGRISTTAHLDGAHVVIRVQDNGIGISRDAQRRIFDMFSQARAALDRAEGGLGVGLAITKGLVEMHGGTIEARSAGLGRGSHFIVKLPLAQAEDSHCAGSADA